MVFAQELDAYSIGQGMDCTQSPQREKPAGCLAVIHRLLYSVGMFAATLNE